MIPTKIKEIIDKKGFKELRPSQKKSIDAGLFEGKNLLVCTPTASGKTLVGELSIVQHVLNGKKGVYIVPLRALASEKFKHFKKEYPEFNVKVSSGEVDSADRFLNDADIIITTSEKMDSLTRHRAEWINKLGVIVIDEIHLLNDQSRGPTLEVVITLLRKNLKNIQVIGLSATIGNPKELASWLNAELIEDSWRPVELKKGVYFEGEIDFSN
ncbi:MAG: DEAD/DEAH box helicase [Candidatus Woesearchaeota archaeon]